jgi:hypothetical protein
LVAVFVLLYSLLQDITIDITQRDNSHAIEIIEFIGEPVTATANSRYSDAKIIIGASHFRKRHNHSSTDRCGTFNKISACKVIHCKSPFTLSVFCINLYWVVASKLKALGMVHTGNAIPKLRLRLPRF